MMHAESHDIVKRDFLKNHCDIRFEAAEKHSCILRGTSRSRGKYDAENNGKLSTGGI